jgi:hypothetical protein
MYKLIEPDLTKDISIEDAEKSFGFIKSGWYVIPRQPSGTGTDVVLATKVSDTEGIITVSVYFYRAVEQLKQSVCDNIYRLNAILEAPVFGVKPCESNKPNYLPDEDYNSIYE